MFFFNSFHSLTFHPSISMVKPRHREGRNFPNILSSLILAKTRTLWKSQRGSKQMAQESVNLAAIYLELYLTEQQLNIF